ncbi:Sec-independent protein translocase subunit TatA/TatB [Sporolituus thermophilus]|uniref:Sec-independent protein translocase protein TatA n=1 Tax=Sporolituus thermophilus DSM 23256 TaxID=1123285 RepID=A0A1G7JIV4_9FIRM|nr:twin-arginine translocase TatA/TatE family subunit [Sporolituus thermophilus]SDF24860.1 Sec-independent protein translocase TatA [Sporolituus thermophilus DSM 23256]
MFNFSMSELVVILIIALVVFGPSKLPEIGRAFGKSIKEFKAATSDVKEEVQKAVSLDTPANKEQSK